MRSLCLLISATAALALAGCGGSSSTAGQSSSSAETSASATAPHTTTTGQATAPTTTSAPTTSTTAGPSICRASDLSGSFLGGQAATGHGLLGFALHNSSGHTCTTFGYPGIQFLSQAGRALPTLPTHTTTDFFGSLPKLPLTVAPGASVSFRLGVTHGAASAAGCTTAHGLQVIPPNDTATLRIPIANGAFECQTATVSPMQRGTSAYP